MSETTHRVAIVTGATSGIGEAIARKFIASGKRVVGTGRNEPKLRSLEQELGDNFHGVAGDAANPVVLESLFVTAIAEFGQEADIIVVNAGRGLGGSVKDADLTEFEEMIRTNLTGALMLLQKASRRLVEIQKTAFPKSAADIVIVGSVVGRHVSPFSAVYGSSKFALHSLAEGLRREIASTGVRVTLVEPGIVVSGFQAVAKYSDELVNQFHERFGPLIVGEDIANAVEFVVSQPPHVHVSDILVRPTRQDYP